MDRTALNIANVHVNIYRKSLKDIANLNIGIGGEPTLKKCRFQEMLMHDPVSRFDRRRCRADVAVVGLQKHTYRPTHPPASGHKYRSDDHPDLGQGQRRLRDVRREDHLRPFSSPPPTQGRPKKSSRRMWQRSLLRAKVSSLFPFDISGKLHGISVKLTSADYAQSQ